MATQTNIVLVHGAWADGSSWSGVIPLLQDAGYYVEAVQLPLTGLDQDIAATRRTLNRLEGPTVLVAHSYGGFVTTLAAVDAPNVFALVYVAAYVPAEGETLLDINGRFANTVGVTHIKVDAEGYAWLDPEAMPSVFAADVDPVQARIMAAVQKPNAGAAFGAKAGKPAWLTIPSWYIVSENDLTINPDAERWMAERIKATTSSLASSHASLVSHPREVADVIIEAARSKASA